MNKLQRRLLYAVFGLSALLSFYLAFCSQWTDSELWSLGSARIFNFSPDAIGFDRLLFMALLRVIYFFKIGNVETIALARFLFAAIGVGIGAMLYGIARADGADRERALWTAFLFLTTSFFFSQGFRIRADGLTVLLQLTAIWYFLRGERRAVPVVHALLLLTTPKAVFHLAINFVYLWCRGVSARELARSFVLPVGFLGLVVALRPQTFLGALEYFVASFREGNGHPGLFNADAFRYVTSFALENPLLLVLIPFGFFARAARDRISDRALSVSALAALAFIGLHNDRLPFFILGMLPFPLLWLGTRTAWLWRSRAGKAAVGATLVLLAVPMAQRQASRLVNGNNQLQRETIGLLERYRQEHPNAFFYDGIITLPRDAFFYVLPAPEHAGNLESVKAIFSRDELELVFFSTRLGFYLRDLYGLLRERSFIQVGSGIFARARVLDAQPMQKFDEAELTNLCHELRAYGELRVYEGNDFLTMRAVPPERFRWKCYVTQEDPWFAERPSSIELVTAEPYIAISRFGPVELPGGQSFARIFDNDTGN